MKLTILIHNLNREAALARCLNSVACQLYRPLEVIVLDAGSTDGSRAVIDRACYGMHERGIEARVLPCARMGVAASRNLAARHASGDLLCFIDNDATFADADRLHDVVRLFLQQPRLALVSFRVLRRESEEVDPVTWIFRRPRDIWSKRMFETSVFTGGACCIRSDSFREVGGYWDHLRYGREEEDLGLALAGGAWEMVYSPAVAVRHFPEGTGRMSLAEQRFGELRNGILVLWRRVPIPLALVVILGRICTMSVTARREKNSMVDLLCAVPGAVAEWRRAGLRRVPVSYRSAWRCTALHLGF